MNAVSNQNRNLLLVGTLLHIGIMGSVYANSENSTLGKCTPSVEGSNHFPVSAATQRSFDTSKETQPSTTSSGPGLNCMKPWDQDKPWGKYIAEFVAGNPFLEFHKKVPTDSELSCCEAYRLEAYYYAGQLLGQERFLMTYFKNTLDDRPWQQQDLPAYSVEERKLMFHSSPAVEYLGRESYMNFRTKRAGALPWTSEKNRLETYRAFLRFTKSTDRNKKDDELNFILNSKMTVERFRRIEAIAGLVSNKLATINTKRGILEYTEAGAFGGKKRKVDISDLIP